MKLDRNTVSSIFFFNILSNTSTGFVINRTLKQAHQTEDTETILYTPQDKRKPNRSANLFS